MPIVNVFERRAVVTSRLHQDAVNTKGLWQMLPEVQLQSGDVLIKHVWTVSTGASRTRSGVEGLIRFGGMLNVFDAAGSQSAEHAALVGRVGDEVRIFEAEGEGIRTKSGDALAALVKNTAYTVFRCENGGNPAFKQGMQMLCDAMATRLAQIENGAAPEITNMPRYAQIPQDEKFREIAGAAHRPCIVPGVKKQEAKYSFFRLISPLFPAIIPDSLYSHHHKRVEEFIAGKKENISYICSGFAATMLHTWHLNYFKKRVFTDSSLVHPTSLEHHLMKGHLTGFIRVGRHGGGVGGAH